MRISRTGFALVAFAASMPTCGKGQTVPTYSANTPSSIMTPDVVNTRIGALKSFDGLPDPETVQKVYDHLDFIRGVEAFLMVYDGQTRSMLETDQKLAGLDSTQKGIEKNPDGSVTVWFAPKAAAGHEANWVQTMPGKGWNSLLRLYAPLEPWFDKSWKPGDFELAE